MIRSLSPILIGLLFAIGCASTNRPYEGRRLASVRPERPEIDITSCEHRNGRQDIWITSQLYGADTIQIDLTSVDNKIGFAITAELIGGTEYGQDYEYQACLTYEDIAKVGGSGVLTVNVGMIDNGVVLRRYFVDRNNVIEIDPLASDDSIAVIASNTSRNN